MAATLSPASKTCKYAPCGEVFGPRPDEGPKRWAVRRYHSTVCARRDRPRVVLEAKPCEHCGGEFTRHDGEGPTAFEARRFGSDACARAARWGKSPDSYVRTRPTARGRTGRPRTPEPVIPVVRPGGLWRPNAPGWDPSGPRVA